MKKLHFELEINAPSHRVYNTMIEDRTYREWAAAFGEGCYFEGSWNTNDKIRFLSPQGGGMLSEIAMNKANEYISIRHLGMIINGKEDTQSEAVKAWVPAYENYTLVKTGEKTQLKIDLDIADEWEEFMSESWPQALSILKEICESNIS